MFCCYKRRQPIREFLIDKSIQKKVLLIGKCGIGKTSWIQSVFTYDTFKSNVYLPTIGVDYASVFYNPEKNTFISPLNIPDSDEYIYKIGIWDSSGDNRFIPIIKSYVDKVNEIWLCVNSKNMLEIQKEIEEWKLKLQFSRNKLYIFHLPSSTLLMNHH